MEIKSNLKYIAAFNFVSLTDIVMLLLIFFLLASSFLLQPGIKVKLPKARAVESESEKNIILTLTSEGNVFFNYESIAWDDLPARLYQSVLKQPGSMIVIMADEDVPLNLAVKLLDIARGAGGEKFFIATQPKSD
ncbi:MAG: biopolymer transporter ExbD [candidate division WOR-3 bacterium]